MLLHNNLEILLFSNHDFLLSSDPDMFLHNNLEILPILKCNWSEKFEWLLYSKVEMLLHINFEYCIDIDIYCI